VAERKVAPTQPVGCMRGLGGTRTALLALLRVEQLQLVFRARCSRGLGFHWYPTVQHPIDFSDQLLGSLGSAALEFVAHLPKDHGLRLVFLKQFLKLIHRGIKERPILHGYSLFVVHTRMLS
jgi:hypothetical protein